MSNHHAFEQLSLRHPYFVVCTKNKHRGHQPARGFWESGRVHANVIWRLAGLEPNQCIGPVLDFGCGVGRIAAAMTPECKHPVERLYLVDAMPQMLEHAVKNVPGGIPVKLDDWVERPPKVELAYSVMTLQHIEQGPGLVYLALMLNHANRVVLDILTDDQRSKAEKALYELSFKSPVKWLFNAIHLRPPWEPRIRLYAWERSQVWQQFTSHNFSTQAMCGGNNGWLSEWYSGKRRSK